jgi:DNA-binding transcriptional regulator YiaG
VIYVQQYLTYMDKYCLSIVVMTKPPKSPAERIRRSQGDKIRSQRKLLKMSQDVFAAEVGVTAAAVSEWENGKSSPRPHLQVAIAKALHMPWSTLFGLDAEGV